MPEQRYLVEIDLSLDDEIATEAKRQTVKMLREQRTRSTTPKRSKQRKYTVQEALQHCLDKLRQQSTEDDNGFADADELFETVVEMLSATQTIQQDTVDGRPAADVLTERLNQMEWPEFFLLAHGVLRTNDVEPMAAAWLEEMHATCDEEPEE